jgi:RNA polymerase sigma-70 factor (ECF subfamily)
MPSRQPPEDLARLADEDLLARVTEGDDRAFEMLYDRHSRVAYSLAFRLLGDRAAAEDLTQDVFLAAWRLAASYSPGRGSVRTWLLAILHNRGIDRLRTQGAMQRRQAALEREALSTRPTPDAAEVVERRAEAAHVRAALTGLPAEQLQVLKLAYYGGFTHQEISEMLELPLGTVKSRMHLGLQRVRRRLLDPGVATA